MFTLQIVVLVVSKLKACLDLHCKKCVCQPFNYKIIIFIFFLFFLEEVLNFLFKIINDLIPSSFKKKISFFLLCFVFFLNFNCMFQNYLCNWIEGSDVGMKREEEEYVYMELCVMSFFFGVEYVCQNFKDSWNVGGGIGGLLRDNCMQGLWLILIICGNALSMFEGSS